MITLETARKLRDAGLPWEPKVRDLIIRNTDFFDLHLVLGFVNKVKTVLRAVNIRNQVVFSEHADKFTWLPSLDQLLDEGERLGYAIEIETMCFGEELVLYHRATVKKWTKKTLFLVHKTDFHDDRAEAAAFAVLWIQEREAE